MGSQIPDSWVRLREIRQLCGGKQSDDNIREAGDRGLIKCKRDENGTRLFLTSSAVRWLQGIDRRANAESRKAIEKITRRAWKERRRGNKG